MLNDRFVWHEGEIEFVDEEEFKKTAELYQFDDSNPFSCCSCNPNCDMCSEDDRKIASLLAEKIQISYFNGSAVDISLAQKVSECCIWLCEKLLPSEITLTRELYCSTKIQLLERLLENYKDNGEELKEIFLKDLIRSENG